ncbi:hypothetical protein [uncultured Mediterranean phage uvMED]|nr:hypothetical protein [uncultured Mediterranean phage uvMED]
MATVDLGKISFTQKGTYAAGTTYAVKDVVQFSDQNETSSFVKINSSASGQTPQTNGTVNTAHWAIFAKGTSVASANQGTFASGTTYKKGDIVQQTDTGVLSTFLYINNTPASGQTPSTSGTVNTTYWQHIAKGTASVALAWASSITTAATLTAVAGNGYWIDTTSNACTVTFPGSASVGDEIVLSDVSRNWATNAVTINQNSLKFQGGTTPNPIYNVSGQTVRCIYSGATHGWIPLFDDTVTYETKQPYTITYLVVGGGGAGGSDSNGGNNSGGGGGGAGGFRTGTFSGTANTVYSTTVGSGGAGSGTSSGTSGTASTLSGSGLTTISSAGGGGGGREGSNGLAGGSGGGGGSGNDGPNGTGGAGNTPSTSPSQGNPGGGTNAPTNYNGGGGGGATNSGANSANATGGAGTASSITGSSVTYAGGGGGGMNSGTSSGGAGGGGNGTTSNPGNAGTNGLGGGGAGSGQAPTGGAGGAGGTGTVILSMATANYSATVTGNPAVTTSGSNTILTYSGNGSYTA